MLFIRGEGGGRKMMKGGDSNHKLYVERNSTYRHHYGQEFWTKVIQCEEKQADECDVLHGVLRLIRHIL